MFMRAVRSHAKYGAAALGATTALSYTHSEPRVYASGEALGRGIRLELWKAKHENVVVLDLESELIQLGMTRIRSYENAGAQFVHDANNVLRAALDLALTELPNDEEAVVTTPRGHKTEGLVFEDDVKVVGISIAKKPEVQKGLQQVLESTLPFDSKFGEILVADAGKGEFKIVTASLPDELDGHDVLLLCPDFAALEQVSKILHGYVVLIEILRILQLLRQQGVEEEKITVVTLVTCPEAADGFCQSFGDARLVTASFDAARDKDGCIIPGIGDFEDRYAGQAATVVELPGEAESESDESDVAKKLTSWWPFGSKN